METTENTSSIQLQGAVLMIGSLYWETQANALKPDLGKRRDEWRKANFAGDHAHWIECPIRYGRLSDSRKNTFTMMFSNSVPVNGSAPLVPFLQTVSVDNEFEAIYQQAHELAYVEGIIEAEGSTLLSNWGMVALYVNPLLEANQLETATFLKKWWARHFVNLKANTYRIDGTEEAAVTAEGLVNFSIEIPENIDYVFCTPVVPKSSAYPSFSEVADKINTAHYADYLLNNLDASIRTFQDEAILSVLNPVYREIRPLPVLDDRVLTIAKYAKTQAGLWQFREDLMQKLGTDLFAPSKELLCSKTVSLLAKRNGVEIADRSSDELLRYCESLTKQFTNHFGDHAVVMMIKLNSIADAFLYHFFDFESVPGEEKIRIETLLLEDLRFINDQVAMYKKYPPIQALLEKNAAPRNHEERTLVDFYKRCSKERQIILDYFFNNLNDRVITKCRTKYFRVDGDFEWYRDRPYQLAIPKANRFFDHRQIDTCRHRLKQVPYNLGPAFIKMYREDPKAFYEALQEYNPFGKALAEIQNNISFVPDDKRSRKALFQELAELFNAKSWYGFYALGLSQVEGLFTDMARMINASENNAALPDKVSALRPYYTFAFAHFDYFQYHVPNLRNRFMHAGLEDNLEIRSYDVLYDLQHLLEIYLALKTPLQELMNIINQRPLGLFFNVTDFSHYFSLLDSAEKNSQLEKIRTSVNEFEQNFILHQVDFATFSMECETELQKSFQHYYEMVSWYTKYNRGEVNLFTLTEHQITKKKEEIAIALKPFYYAYTDIFTNLETHRRFLVGLKKWLPLMDKDNREQFDRLYERFKSDFKKLELIRLSIGVKDNE